MTEKVKKIIVIFAQAGINVLETMAMVKAGLGKAYIKKDQKAVGDVSGIIGFSSKSGSAKGSMSVTFSEASALGIVGSMLGEEYPEVNDEVKDAVGEMTNMICGQARKDLVEMDMIFEAGTPSVVTGKNHTIRHVSERAILAIPLDTSHGSLSIEVCIG
ncbi:CheC domain protein [Desulfonatronospira thiodismutans ASO3-1]|uniref:CheC domain protein n=1 Tax=Desulfonatronospira thiodismutans ASO3-1 TaxID=555779 RepID=D6SSH8_9BACT|nr:chemotaxis protein CheX [Desulfonatronospira thiodismutans]EFI33644.1 CheC domain protein [Desulfonatronospira thiodismutans ASO3-1]